MPTLNWIGKEAVINHHHDVKFRLLKDVAEHGSGDPGTGNLIVEGDNLEALKALLPYYAGQVKCIYIDPPYNTGNEGWVYNDNMKSPLITEWLGKVVGKEGETLDRHDRWLCMMYPRLALLREFLREDGVMFISINDAAGSLLELIAKEIFGAKNLLARLIWNTEGNTDNQLEVKINHEYVLMFLKDIERKAEAVGSVIDPNTREDSNLWKGIADNNINKNNPANPPDVFTIPEGFPSVEKDLFYARKELDEDFFTQAEAEGKVTTPLKKKYHIESQSGLPVKLDDLVVADYKVQKPCRVYGGFANRRKLEQFVKGGFAPVDDDGGPITFYLNRNAAIRYRRTSSSASNILSVIRNVGTTERMRTELANMGLHFDYPKPVSLIKYLLSFGAEHKNSIVLDSFAGSGTTANAVLELNKDDGGERKFICIQMPYENPEQKAADTNIARDLTAKRITLNIEGYTTSKQEKIAPLGGGFRYCKLGEPLFDEAGQIRTTVKFSELARHVWFSETGEPLPRERVMNTPLLGVHRGTAIYLLYNGILGDKSAQGGNVLTRAVLAVLPAFDGPKVIYAAACLLGPERLSAYQITVRQTPKQIRIA